MNLISIILLTIGVLMLIEGLLVCIWPKAVRKMVVNVKKLRKAGVMEIIVAVILIGVGLVLAIAR